MKSDSVKVGAQQAPHRSLFNALGYTKEEMERPLIGIVCSYNEIVPGHMNLDKIVCECMGVTTGMIKEAVENGAHTLEDVLLLRVRELSDRLLTECHNPKPQ